MLLVKKRCHLEHELLLLQRSISTMNLMDLDVEKMNQYLTRVRNDHPQFFKENPEVLSILKGQIKSISDLKSTLNECNSANLKQAYQNLNLLELRNPCPLSPDVFERKRLNTERKDAYVKRIIRKNFEQAIAVNKTLAQRMLEWIDFVDLLMAVKSWSFNLNTNKPLKTIDFDPSRPIKSIYIVAIGGDRNGGEVDMHINGTNVRNIYTPGNDPDYHHTFMRPVKTSAITFTHKWGKVKIKRIEVVYVSGIDGSAW
jgi:hypothetical protein